MLCLWHVAAPGVALDSEKTSECRWSTCMEAQSTEIMQQEHGLAFPGMSHPPYAVSWNSGFLFHTAHYLFLAYLVRSCAIDCVLVQLLPVIPHEPAPPNNLLQIRKQPFSMARRVAVQRAWLGAHHYIVRGRKRGWSIQTAFQTNQNTAQG